MVDRIRNILKETGLHYEFNEEGSTLILSSGSSSVPIIDMEDVVELTTELALNGIEYTIDENLNIVLDI